MDARRTLLEIFSAALRAVDGHACVAAHLRRAPPGSRVAVFAIGKAAGAMARGAHAALGAAITQTLVITKDGHADPELMRLPGCRVLQSAHPVPDERSLAAGAELVARLAQTAPDVLPLFLVSGGSSSLVEQLRVGATLEGLRELNQHGLAAGWPIARLNAARGTLSQIKGGGIARLLGGRRALALFISDVPGDDPDVIGSGLLGRSGNAGDAIERVVVANVERAMSAAVEAGHGLGVELAWRAQRIADDATEVARDFVAQLRGAPLDGLVWGGESTVTLPARHGRGGRNTHLALAAARELRAGERLTVLAAGTDGSDGPTDDAGAIVDGGTVQRAELAGCDVERAFAQFDSNAALEASADLLHTGPTGTNVGDLLIGLRQSAGAFRGDPASRML